MNKTELESKHLSELHSLAAKAGIPRYRMLPRGELIAKLSDERPKREQPGRPKRERQRSQRDRKPRQQRKPREQRPAEPKPAPPQHQPAAAEPAAGRPKRKRRRRRWGRRRKGGVRVHDLLLPPSAGGRAVVYAESREGCTALLREVAAELAGASKGPDPIALLVDPSPEELAEWKREAPQAEIVAAGQARHADDALAQAVRRANGGEDVIVLIDSLTRFAEDFAGPDEARKLFDAGSGATGGTLTVVAAVERPT
jgi:Rho termination factor, N-terminal domain